MYIDISVTMPIASLKRNSRLNDTLEALASLCNNIIATTACLLTTPSKLRAVLPIKPQPIVALTLTTKMERQRNVFVTFVIPLDQCFCLLNTIGLQQLQPISGALPWFMLLKSEIPLFEREKNGQHCKNLRIPTTNRMSNNFTHLAARCTTWIQSFRAEIHWRINGAIEHVLESTSDSHANMRTQYHWP